MDKYSFEIMEIRHFDEVATLWKEELGLSPNDKRDSISAYLTRNENMSYICKSDPGNEVIGAVLAGHDGRHGYIYHLAVKKDHRRKGIASQLVNLSRTALQKEGILRINIGIISGSTEAEVFWKRSGWRKLENLNFYSYYPDDLK
ncbi:MAG: GNAT family N-acetyltransferase [Ignavibacteria bacterium]|nr:GNAT family N-acetyltransferase [Ignavibacteria bacterium]